MKEIEAKFEIINIEDITKRITSLGAMSHEPRNQIDTYFKHTKSTQLSNVPTYLRVRTSNEQSYIGFHYKLDQYVWEEVESKIEEGDKIRLIFQLLGFKIDVEVKKKRSVFMLEDTEIVIDEVENLGTFLEIESPSVYELKKISSALGFDLEFHNNPLEGKSYADLLREKNIKEDCQSAK